jgi:MOSC domain-containing protein YiiM/GNAT superfamily N-acetyltransferase
MQQAGRVLQVNVSRGGVPKTPVAQAWVGRLGVAGDGHRERTVHGGPHRAVCLFGIEAIERLQAEGHPVEPGAVGENLTTAGVEWSTLPVGTRARVGSRLLLELASSTTPCSTQKHNFSDGRFSRISIELHPTDSRMYARVLEEGPVAAGDAIEILPPAADSRATTEALLTRIGGVEQRASLRLWAAARAAGLAVEVLDDGDICAGASRELTSHAFNHAQGLRMLPQLLPEILAHFDRFSDSAVIPHVAPYAGAEPATRLATHVARPEELHVATAEADVAIEQLTPDDGEQTAACVEAYTSEMEAPDATAWRALMPHLLATRDVHAFVARLAGQAVGVGFLHVSRRVGLIKGAYVQPRARGHGLQRALVAARARLAGEIGCDLVAAMAEAGSTSARNLERAGLRHIDTHPLYEYVPTNVSGGTGAAV